jgi:hypothetical protein
MQMPGMPPAPATAPTTRATMLLDENPGVDAPGSGMPWPAMLASTDPHAALLARPAAKPAPKSAHQPVSKPNPPYRAVFSDEVKVLEGSRQVARADTMTIDFMQGSDTGPAAAAAKPGSSPNIVAVPAQTVPAEAGTPVKANARAANSKVAASPATRPANQPIEILWTGPLVVKPLESEAPMMPLQPKQSVVRLVGAPAVLTPEGAEVRAASVTYRTPDGAVQLRSSPALPIVDLMQIKQKVKQVELRTGSLDYDPQTRIATLTSPPAASGPSLLTMPLANQKQPLTVRWSRNGYIHTVVPVGQTQPSGADQIDLLGDVAVAHPTFALDSDELHIHLAIVPRPHGKKGDTTEQPKLLTAIGEVKCRLISPGKPVQGINSDKLTIAMEQSSQDKPYPRRVLAEGNAYAYDPDQHLTADRLEILLTPKPVAATTRPTGKKPATTDPTDDMASAVQMESLHATSNVRAVMKDKSTADCDDLQVSTLADGKQLVELSGDHGATLADGKGSWLTGSVVHIAPASNVITVDGEGRMHTIETSASSTTKPTSKPASKPVSKAASNPTTRPATSRPIDISWTDSMNVDGTANTADIVGHVIVHTIDTGDSGDTGGVSTVTGDTAHIDFVDAPKPPTQPSAAVKSNPKKPVAANEGSTFGMGNKQLKRLTLTGHVHGESVLKDADRKLLRHAQLFGNQLIYTAADHRAVIPGPGKLMVENHKSSTKPAAGSDTGNGQGNMNVVWTKFLVYDQTANVITIDGETHTHFQQDAQSPKQAGRPGSPQAEKDQPMELDAQRLVVTLKNSEPAKVVAGSPRPAAANSASENGKMQLSHLLAVGNVHFSAKAVDFDAHSVDYDPRTQIMIARGTDQEPGETRDADGRGNGSFDELIYDVQAQEVKSVTGMHGTLRR